MNEAKIINDPVFGFIKIPRGLLYDIVKQQTRAMKKKKKKK